MFARSSSKKLEARLTYLRSKLWAGETEFAQSMGWERVGSREAEMVMLVTDQRVLWTHMGGPNDVALDIAFKDVVAFLGSEREGGLILEANEPRYAETSEGQTTIALFRLKGTARRSRSCAL